VQYIEINTVLFAEDCQEASPVQQDRQKVHPAAAIGRAVKGVISNSRAVRRATGSFGISKPKLRCHLLKFQDKKLPTDFEHTAKNNIKKMFSVTREFELVDCLIG
jgi:hypothetical protein